MPLFRLRHPNPDFHGVAGGVDFSRGIGTTSALSYAHGLVKTLNCRAFMVKDHEEQEIEILEELNKGGTMVLSYRSRKQMKEEGAVELAPSSLSQVAPQKPAARRGRQRK